MTRIDSATITLDVWDDTLGMRREVTFPVDLGGAVIMGGGPICTNYYAIAQWWALNDERIRLAARDAPDMGPLTL